nr:proprotein convertase P-domain-containing protein [bacterium]
DVVTVHRGQADRKDVLLGDEGNDQLTGGYGEDWIFGGPGDDVLSGGADFQAMDLIWGEDGDDTFLLEPSGQLDPSKHDIFDGGDGRDTVLLEGTEGNDGLLYRWRPSLSRFEVAKGIVAGSDLVDGEGIAFRLKHTEHTQLEGKAGNDELVCVAELIHVLQVENFEGSWNSQTNIPGYLGTGFKTSNANGVAATVMTGQATIARGGSYAVWARGYEGEGLDRSFSLTIDGQDLLPTHTRPVGGFNWQYAGYVQLEPGEIEVVVQDRGDSYESVDAVLLTTDLTYGPRGPGQPLVANAAVEVLGGEGDDLLIGGAADDVLVGGTGHDELYGGSGADILYGDGRDGTGGGHDLVFGDADGDGHIPYPAWVLSPPTDPTPLPGLPDTVHPLTGHYYRATSQMGWRDAVSSAAEGVLHPVIVNDHVENEWIAGQASPAGGAEGSYWLGMTDAAAFEMVNFFDLERGPEGGIWDHQRTERVAWVSGGLQLSEMRLELYIEHGDLEDLVVTLTDPLGRTVTFLDRPDIDHWRTDRLYLVTGNRDGRPWTELGGNLYGSEFGEIYDGMENLSVFSGLTVPGEWVFSVEDRARRDEGWFEWSLYFGRAMSEPTSASEGNWVWTNGQAATYTDWDSDEPDNGAYYEQDFASLTDGVWRDRGEVRRLPMLLESTSSVNPANGHVYTITPEAMTWAEAEVFAQSIGGHLASVDSAAEQTWLQQAFADRTYWLGRSDGRGDQTVSLSAAPGYHMPDNYKIQSMLDVPAGLALEQATVDLDVSHQRPADLFVSLTSPSGTNVKLHEFTPGSSDGISGTYGATLSAFGALSTFEGEDPTGTWTLTVVDNQSGVDGYINSWGLGGLRWGLPALSGHYAFDGNAEGDSDTGDVAAGEVSGPLLATDRHGEADSAYSFNQYLDLIELPHEILDGAEDVSVSLWLKTTQTNCGVLSGATAGSDNEFLIWIDGNGKIRPHIKDSTITGATAINDDEWHHVVVTRRLDGTVQIYIDGSLDATGSKPSGTINIAEGGLWLGNDQDLVGGGWSSAQQFTGLLDDLRIYDGILSASEVGDVSLPKAASPRRPGSGLPVSRSRTRIGTPASRTTTRASSISP